MGSKHLNRDLPTLTTLVGGLGLPGKGAGVQLSLPKRASRNEGRYIRPLKILSGVVIRYTVYHMKFDVHVLPDCVRF